MLRDNDSGQPVDNIKAVTQIFEEYEGFIREIIKRWDPADAEDLFQDFFLFLVSKPVPDYVQNIKGYIYRALTNDIHDFFRQSTSYRSRLKRYAAMMRNNQRVKTESQVCADNDAAEHIFRLAAKTLPPYLARTFNLHFREQCNIQEISKRIGVPPRAVSVYLSKAVRQVRECMGNDDEPESMATIEPIIPEEKVPIQGIAS